MKGVKGTPTINFDKAHFVIVGRADKKSSELPHPWRDEIGRTLGDTRQIYIGLI